MKKRYLKIGLLILLTLVIIVSGCFQRECDPEISLMLENLTSTINELEMKGVPPDLQDKFNQAKSLATSAKKKLEKKDCSGSVEDIQKSFNLVSQISATMIERETEKTMECISASLDIISSEYNENTKELSLIIDNSGVIDINEMKIEILYTDGEVKETTISEVLPPGVRAVYKVNNCLLYTSPSPRDRG